MVAVAEPARLARMKILVVDDHVLIREKLAAPSAFWKPPARHLQQGLGPDGVT
jgi:hypothetical protein